MNKKMNIFNKMALTMSLASLAIVFVLGAFIMKPVTAEAGTVSTVSATESSGKVTVSGTVESGVMAVAIMAYESDGTTLKAMETAAVDSAKKYSYTLAETFAEGTYTIKVADYDGGAYAETTVTVGQAEGVKPEVKELSDDILSTELKEKGYTAAKVKTEILEALKKVFKTANLKFVEKQVLFMDIPMIDQVTGQDVSADYKDKKVTVHISYPEGTDRSYTFKVLHMFGFTSTVLSHKAGEIEDCKIVKDATGITITMNGMSPVAVSWTKTASPKTSASDSAAGNGRAAIVLGIFLAAGIALGMALKGKKE